MTILDCCTSLKMIKNILVVLGVVDIRQLLLNTVLKGNKNRHFLTPSSLFKPKSRWICAKSKDKFAF